MNREKDEEILEEKINQNEEFEIPENVNDESKTEKDDMALLREKVSELEKQAKENYDLYIRALANGENQRKRWMKDREELVRYGNLPLLRQLLEVADDFKRARAAIETGGDDSTLLKGVEMIEKKLLDIMTQEGVTAIEAIGRPFDPRQHEAFSVEEGGEYGEDTVVGELQGGYMYKDRVLRPSLVKVARGAGSK